MEELIRRIEDLKGLIQHTFDEQRNALNGHIARMMEVLAAIHGVANEAQKLLTEGESDDEA